jgi:hypothetical protein
MSLLHMMQVPLLASGRGHYYIAVTRLLAGCWHSSERGTLVGGEALCTHHQMFSVSKASAMTEAMNVLPAV